MIYQWHDVWHTKPCGQQLRFSNQGLQVEFFAVNKSYLAKKWCVCWDYCRINLLDIPISRRIGKPFSTNDRISREGESCVSSMANCDSFYIPWSWYPHYVVSTFFVWDIHVCFSGSVFQSRMFKQSLTMRHFLAWFGQFPSSHKGSTRKYGWLISWYFMGNPMEKWMDRYRSVAPLTSETPPPSAFLPRRWSRRWRSWWSWMAMQVREDFVKGEASEHGESWTWIEHGLKISDKQWWISSSIDLVSIYRIL